MSKKKQKCQFCGCKTDLICELDNNVGGEQYPLKLHLTATVNGEPFYLCRNCFEAFIYQWGSEIRNYESNGKTIYILTAIAYWLKEHYKAKNALEKLIKQYEETMEIIEENDTAH